MDHYGSSSPERHIIQGTTSPMSRSFESLNTDNYNDTAAVLSSNDLGVQTRRGLKDYSRKDIGFLVVTGLALAAALAFTIFNLATINVQETDCIVAAAILLNILFCTFYLIHGVHRERPSEICILLINTISLVAYFIIYFSHVVQIDFKLVGMIVAIVCEVVIVFMGVCVVIDYWTQAKLVIRTVGANDELQRCCQIMYIFLDLLKLGLQLGITLLIFNIQPPGIFIYAILSHGFIISGVWFGVGVFMVKLESKASTVVFFVLTLVEIGFAVFTIWMDVNLLQENPVLAPCTLTAAGFALLTDVCVLFCTCLVYKNFGKGLTEKVYGTTNHCRPL